LYSSAGSGTKAGSNFAFGGLALALSMILFMSFWTLGGSFFSTFTFRVSWNCLVFIKLDWAIVVIRSGLNLVKKEFPKL
jgi:hypothetical protein